MTFMGQLSTGTKVITLPLLVALLSWFVQCGVALAQEQTDPDINAGGETHGTMSNSATSPGILERETLTGDWGGGRTWLKERGITLEPRLTQFYQGMTAGEGDEGFEYGGKADLLLKSELGKLGLWDGLSLTVHAEYNFGQSVNGIGGTMLPVNTALQFPGMDGADAFDVSSFYFGQTVGDSFSMVLGKINMVDFGAGKPFAGGAGIDGFWNIAFTAPPSGTVPPYLLGALLSFKTEPATFGLWIFDANSVVNQSGLSDPFADGFTVRGIVSFPVSIADRKGHQGFAVSYSNKDGTDLEDLGDIFLPTPDPGTIDAKDDRYYFAYFLDQYLYQSKANSKEGFGLFGQAAISDGNPNKLDWNVLVGLGGTGLIPGASRDNWGVGYFYYSVSDPFKEALAPIVSIRDEQGLEIFYNHSLTPWFVLGLDLQIISPARADETAIFPGVRAVIRF